MARPSKRKVFGIGLSKTGTTSLQRALNELGLPGWGFNRSLHLLELDGDTLSMRADRAAKVSSVTDTVAAWGFRELDAAYPGSRFILTTRDVHAWLRSCRTHFAVPSKDPNRHHIRLALYGCPSFDEDRFAWAYESHRRRVLDHFADRPGDLLQMDISAGAGWAELCPFVDRPVPATPFPHANKTSTERRIRRRLRSLWPFKRSVGG